MRAIWPISQIKRKLHERKAKHKHEKLEEKAARRTADATVWIAIFTVVLAIASLITLYEIIEGGADTHALAIAAGKQADTAKIQSENTAKLASAASDQVNKLAALTSATIAQNKVLADQLEAMNRSMRLSETQSRAALEASARAIEAEQRPWILPRFIVRDPLRLEGSTVKIVVIPHLSNTGHSPALLVRHVIELIRGPMGPIRDESDQEVTARLVRTQQVECATAAQPLNPFAVFPGDDHESIPAVLSYDLSPYKTGGPHFFSFYVSICIDYQLPFSHEHRQTTYLGMVNGNPDPVAVVGVDANGDFTLSDTAQRHEIVEMATNAN